jgi:hypothetical protein
VLDRLRLQEALARALWLVLVPSVVLVLLALRVLAVAFLVETLVAC